MATNCVDAALIAAMVTALLVACSSIGRIEEPSSRTAGPATATQTFVASALPTGGRAPIPPNAVGDAHGFRIYGQGARCFGSDEAEMFMRTELSALVICREKANRLYYRGYRISDGASIDLYEVSRQEDGFVAHNVSDNARYVITSNGFDLIVVDGRKLGQKRR